MKSEQLMKLVIFGLTVPLDLSVFYDLDASITREYFGRYPSVKWQRFSGAIPLDLRGMTVLDIGCNAGFYSIEMKERGADRVVGIDNGSIYLDQARFAAWVNCLDLEFYGN
jgi:tRNA (mo5U34)-methyltransferase